MLHESLIAASNASRGALVHAREIPEARFLLRQLKLSNAFCRSGCRGGKDATGAVILDVFEVESRPSSPLNVAMLYVVGPKGQRAGRKLDFKGPQPYPRREFLVAIEDLGQKALELVAAYNEIITKEVPTNPSTIKKYKMVPCERRILSARKKIKSGGI